MRSTVKAFARFSKDESGTYAILGALASAVMVGAVGYGLDTYRLENARTELDHVVGLTCDRIENADISLYPDAKSRMAMAKTFAPSLVPQTALEAERTSFKISQNGDKINVAGETEIDAMLMAVVGFSELDSKSERDCTPPSNKPPEKACTADDLIYLNPGKFGIAAGKLVAGQKNYAATLFDSKGNIKARQVVGNGSGVTEVFLKSSNFDDMVVVQPFNADGTTPAACNPTIPCKGDTKICPPPTESVCTRERAAELGRTVEGMLVGIAGGYSYQVPKGKWENSPTLQAAHKGQQLVWTSDWGEKSTLDLAPGFEPEMFFYWERPDLNAAKVYFWQMDNGPQVAQYNHQYRQSGAKIFRVMSDIAAVWEYNGQCIFVQSPIVLDLIGKGEIATTGVSSARYLIPQHRVNATVDFAMGGTGRTMRMEWITGNGQALLVDNRDGKAATDMNGTRLFGNMGGHAHGYLKLATLDANTDNQITGDELTGLAAWIDNGDAKVQAGELKPLSDVGITALSTVMTETPSGDGGVHMRSTAIMNGKTIMTEDVWFGVDLTSRNLVSEMQK